MSDNHPAKLDASGDEQEPTGDASGSEQESAGVANPVTSDDQQEHEPTEDANCGEQVPIVDRIHDTSDGERGPKGRSNNGASGEQGSNSGANSGEQESNSGANSGEQESNSGANSGEQESNSGANSGEQEPMECANLSASSGEQESNESANTGNSGGEQEPESSIGREQDSAKDGTSSAFYGEQKPKEDMSNTEQDPKENTNPDASKTAQVSIDIPNLHVPDGMQIPMRRSNPDPSSSVEMPLEGTRLPLGSAEVEMEDVSTDASKQTTGRHVEESGSPIVPKSTVRLSNEDPEGKYHVCTDVCIHGGARPKIRNPIRRSASLVRESSIDSIVTERMERLNRLVAGIERNLAQIPPDGNISPEEWTEKSGSGNCLTEEFAEPLGYKPIVQIPDDTRSVHGQFDRMFMSLSFDEGSESEGESCSVSQSTLNPYQETFDRPQERNSDKELDDQNPALAFGRAGLLVGQSEDPAMLALPWQMPIDQNAQVKAETQDSVNKDEVVEVLQETDPKHQDEKIDIPEDLDQDDENMEGVEEQDPIHQDQGMEGIEEHVGDAQQPRQEYRLIRLAPAPPANQMGPITPGPRHPYRERELDLWRASMITAYRSERYHNSELLDQAMEQLEAEGVSKEDFYRLYHSTRFIDFYRDEGIDETRTPSELDDMALEDRINEIIIAVGYMSVAMLYMRLYTDRNPQAMGNSSESSIIDSGNIDSSGSEPKVEYAPFREHVNIEIDETISTDTEHPDSENGSSHMAIDSPGNPNSPQGILSPDLIVPQNSNASIASNQDPSILLPLSEVSTRSDTSSSHQSLLSYGDISDTESSSSQLISSSSEWTSTSSKWHSSAPHTPPPSPQSRSSSPHAPPPSPQSRSSSPHAPPSSPQSRSSSPQVTPLSPKSRSSSPQVTPLSPKSRSSSPQVTPLSPKSRSSSPQVTPLSPKSRSSSSQVTPSSPLSRSPSPLSRSPSPLSRSPSPLSRTSSPQASQSQAIPSTSRAPLSTKSVKKDDLKRKAILRSYRSLSRDGPTRDATPVQPDKGNGNEGSAGRPQVVETAGQLISLVVSIFMGLQVIQHESGFASPRNSEDEYNSEAEHSRGAGLESQHKEGSVSQAEDALGQAESQDQVEGEKAEADVEQGVDGQGEHQMKRETEAVDAKDQAEDECESEMDTEGSDESEAERKNRDENQDFHVEVSKTERDRKRKDHPDSDDEFKQLPKRSHIEN